MKKQLKKRTTWPRQPAVPGAVLPRRLPLQRVFVFLWKEQLRYPERRCFIVHTFYSCPERHMHRRVICAAQPLVELVLFQLLQFRLQLLLRKQLAHL